MPTILYILGLRFYFYSNEHDPIHVHVEKDGQDAKFELEPEIRLVENNGLKPATIKKATQIIKDNRDYIVNFWKATFDKR